MTGRRGRGSPGRVASAGNIWPSCCGLPDTRRKRPALNPGSAVRRGNAPAWYSFPRRIVRVPRHGPRTRASRRFSFPSSAVCEMPSPQERRSVPASFCRSGIFPAPLPKVPHHYTAKWTFAQFGTMQHQDQQNGGPRRRPAEAGVLCFASAVQLRALRSSPRASLPRRRGCAHATHEYCPGRGV